MDQLGFSILPRKAHQQGGCLITGFGEWEPRNPGERLEWTRVRGLFKPEQEAGKVRPRMLSPKQREMVRMVLTPQPRYTCQGPTHRA